MFRPSLHATSPRSVHEYRTIVDDRRLSRRRDFNDRNIIVLNCSRSGKKAKKKERKKKTRAINTSALLSVYDIITCYTRTTGVLRLLHVDGNQTRFKSIRRPPPTRTRCTIQRSLTRGPLPPGGPRYSCRGSATASTRITHEKFDKGVGDL